MSGVIDSKTKVPLFVIFGTLPFVVGFIVWITAVAADARKGAASAEVVLEIRERVIRIETMIENQRYKRGVEQ